MNFTALLTDVPVENTVEMWKMAVDKPQKTDSLLPLFSRRSRPKPKSPRKTRSATPRKNAPQKIFPQGKPCG